MNATASVPRGAVGPARTLGRIHTLPAPTRGQFGPDHTVVEVIRPGEWAESDPFILLMDDRLDGRLQAGPHPHAGFETVTFMVDGSFPAEHRGGGSLHPGDVEWTTAGSGIVHGPDQPIEGRLRVLQLWLTLPKALRYTEPDHQIIARTDVPARRTPGVEAWVYSGRSGDVSGPARNRVPVTLLDVQLQPGATLEHEVPAQHAGFLYVLDGEIAVGPARQALVSGQIGWLDRRAQGDATQTTLTFRNPGTQPARVLLYTGARQDDPIAWYGPFIGDSRADIARSFERYQSGAFRRV